MQRYADRGWWQRQYHRKGPFCDENGIWRTKCRVSGTKIRAGRLSSLPCGGFSKPFGGTQDGSGFFFSGAFEESVSNIELFSIFAQLTRFNYTNMYWTLELASSLDDAPWPATKEELIDYANRSGAPEEVIENLEELEEEGEIYETIEDIWPDYPTKDDFFFNEEEY